MFEITKREKMADGTIILNTIKAPLIAKKAKPGQFVILKANEDGERIPLTIADTNVSEETITIVYMVVGKSTSIFKTLKEGDKYQDVIGPLGKATPLEKVGKVICVGGGTGVAVLHPITRALKQIGNEVTCIIGARSKNLMILREQMALASHHLVECTDDGSHGHHGFVTDVLKESLKKDDIKLVVAIGPVPMMKACASITRKNNVKTIVSLNPIMVDGTGMCGGCRVTVGGKTKFACVDGPEFDAHKVDFDELAIRLTSYCKEEKQCFNESCTF